jgi:lipopolysaccharide transport system ATP-binding protein
MSFDQFNKAPSPRVGEGWEDGVHQTHSPFRPGESLPVRESVNDIAIRVSNLGKCYQIYDTPLDRLKQFVAPRLQRLTRQIPKQYFHEFWALKDVSFEVKKGETVGIIGRNGSGKSTLLQMICGTLNPTSGSIQTHGRIAALLELGAGFNPEFSGRENVYMSAVLLGLSREEINKRFDDIVAFADIGEFIEQPVKTYSSGMFVRLAFAVISNVDPDILIVDEALSVGDAFFVQKCMRYLREFMKKGTLLFVSHDMGSILNLTTKSILLEKGRVALSGSPKEVTEKYLEKIYESQQGESVVSKSSNEENEEKSIILNIPELKICPNPNNAVLHYQNDIQLFDFNPKASGFGKGGAKITKVFLCDNNGNLLSWVAGGEQVQLCIRCKAFQKIISPIIGFQVKDRLGQLLFGDVTTFAYIQRPLVVERGEKFAAEFHFKMPILPNGDYSISPAIAEGTQENHIQHHWVHDALIFKVHTQRICFGLFGVTMTHISLKKI